MRTILENPPRPAVSTIPIASDAENAGLSESQSSNVRRRLRSRAKAWINAMLARLNLQMTGLTGQRRENQRLLNLARSGYFDRPAFPLPPALAAMDATPLLAALEDYLPRFCDFAAAERNEVGFSFQNDYFSSPDAELLYTIVRRYQPARIFEIGSGNSTRISRQAILDGGLATRLTCIDPCPRADVSRCADQVFLQPVEQLMDDEVFTSLKSGDILFIDSSHELRPGNDCVTLFLRLLPALPSGVLIHVHDIFLPYDYPQLWLHFAGWDWSEQYLVQALLTGNEFDVLWASHFLMHGDKRLAQLLPGATLHHASSLWLRKR